MLAQSEGNYAEALQNYYEAMRLEIGSYDRSYILYNIGLIHTCDGVEHNPRQKSIGGPCNNCHFHI